MLHDRGKLSIGPTTSPVTIIHACVDALPEPEKAQ